MNKNRAQSKTFSSVLTLASCYGFITVLMTYCAIMVANNYGAHLPVLLIQSTNISGEMLISSFAAAFLGLPLGIFIGGCYWLLVKGNCRSKLQSASHS